MIYLFLYSGYLESYAIIIIIFFSYVSEHEHSFVFCSFCLWIMIDDHYGVY